MGLKCFVIDGLADPGDQCLHLSMRIERYSGLKYDADLAAIWIKLAVVKAEALLGLFPSMAA